MDVTNTVYRTWPVSKIFPITPAAGSWDHFSDIFVRGGRGVI